MSCSEIENRHNANPCYNLQVKKPIFRESSHTSQNEIKKERKKKNERKKERKKERIFMQCKKQNAKMQHE